MHDSQRGNVSNVLDISAPSSIDPKEKGKRYKKYYGSDDSEELSTDPEECMPEVIARKMHERAARRAQRAVSQGKVKGKGHTSTSARGESAQVCNWSIEVTFLLCMYFMDTNAL